MVVNTPNAGQYLLSHIFYTISQDFDAKKRKFCKKGDFWAYSQMLVNTKALVLENW